MFGSRDAKDTPLQPHSGNFFTCHAHKLQILIFLFLIPVRVHARVVEFASAQEDTCGRFGKPGSDHQYPESCDSRWVFVFNFGAGRSSPSSKWICTDNLTKLFIDSGMIVDILQALVGQTKAI